MSPLSNNDAAKNRAALKRAEAHEDTPAQTPAEAKIVELAGKRHDYKWTTNDKGKLAVPSPLPGHTDQDGMRHWLTSAFKLDSDDPITGYRVTGVRGPDAHVLLTRDHAPAMRFEPVSVLDAPQKANGHIAWQRQGKDGVGITYLGEHLTIIRAVIRMLVDDSLLRDADEVTRGLVLDYLRNAELKRPKTIDPEPFTTRGDRRQTYRVQIALRRLREAGASMWRGPCLYIVEPDTGEIVFPRDDFQRETKDHGAKQTRDWFDGRLASIGFEVVPLDAHAEPGRKGNSGPHARGQYYRGLFPDHEWPDDEDEGTA